jgi:hypothetical protein
LDPKISLYAGNNKYCGIGTAQIVICNLDTPEQFEKVDSNEKVAIKCLNNGKYLSIVNNNNEATLECNSAQVATNQEFNWVQSI